MYSIASDYEKSLYGDIFSIVKKSLTIDKNALKENAESNVNVSMLIGAKDE